jgi:hypothetical protein
LSQAGPTDQPLELPSRLVTEDDLAAFCKAMRVYETPSKQAPLITSGSKKKRGSLGGLDTQQYGRGKRAREVNGSQLKKMLPASLSVCKMLDLYLLFLQGC